MELYILDGNLSKVGIIQGWKSLIWAERYKEVGDCELYVPASKEILSALPIGKYLMRSDSDRVCRIKKITLTTDAEKGNYISFIGEDTKSYLDQRIIWETMFINGYVETALIAAVGRALAITSIPARQLLKDNSNRLFYTETAKGYLDEATEQISYKNLGQVIREHCQTYGWGYHVRYNNGALYFGFDKGTDRSSTIIFSHDLDNLNSTQQIIDDTHMGNVALVAGEGEGSDRIKDVVGSGSSVNRYEIYVDARDISQKITYEELTDLYPTGTIEQHGSKYYYVTIPDNVEVAEVPSASPSASDTVILDATIYEDYLQAKGTEALAEYGEKSTLEGSISPKSQFKYKTDFFLGDIVTIDNGYSSTTARIVEIVEVFDDNGYSLEPKFEY